MRRLPLGPMEAFVAVARSGSLARAALAMNLTVPALSRRIQLLEAQLGIQLFDRLPRGVRLTDAGRTYFAALGPAWDSIGEATEAARNRGKRKVVRVTVMPSFAATWLMPRLSRFPDEGVEIELHTSPEFDDLRARPDLDCAIRLGSGPWPGLECEPLLPVHAFPVASPGFFHSGQVPGHPRDLLGLPLIGTHHQPEFWRDWFAAAGIDASLGGYRSFDNLQVVYEAAASGMGVALGLDPVVRPYLETGRLRRLLPSAVRLPRQFHLVRRHGPVPGPGFAPFRAWLQAEAQAFLQTAAPRG